MMILAGASACVAGAWAFDTANDDDGVWRALGLVFFAIVFAIIAWRPRRLPALWEAAILNKAALAVQLARVDAPSSAWIDGALAAWLLAAYVLCRGWEAWLGVTLRERRAHVRPARD